MKENETYYKIQRSDWSQYEGAHPFTMTSDELEHLTSLNDRISLQDVQEVYVPMLDYFDLYFKKHIELRTEEQQFLHQTKKTVPFIIRLSFLNLAGGPVPRGPFQQNKHTMPS